jgi:ABC-type polysaccharide/polyol phosphate transport system ATPase subunit
LSESLITVENLGKRYRIGERERYLALRDVLTRALHAPWRWLRPRAGGASNHHPQFIWALKDVSFEVRQGEVIGMIGRNGAGKTTVLKILARITKPTTGYAEVRGRVGSLLEVGTGFHPELTGRENVYLSGAILGMTKNEIRRKFDEIVAFAEVENFLDTPLKHYSAGMQTRLAFAVAAHLEPEILLVDEVLAVGDIAFQKKCLGKMSDVARGGRTVLFISHQMNQIRRLCERVIWLDRGQVRNDGPGGEVVSAYEALHLAPDNGSDGRCFVRWEIAGQGHVVRDNFGDLTFQVQLKLDEPVSQGHFGLCLLDELNRVVVGWGFDHLDLPSGVQELRMKVPMLPIRPGAYTVLCSLFNEGNNLTGGELIEDWYATTLLLVDTKPVAHPQDQWAGMLNIPAELRVSEGVALRQELAGGP